MVFISKINTRFRLVGLALFIFGILFLSCTSVYDGPLRFSYENRETTHPDNSRFPGDNQGSDRGVSNLPDIAERTKIDDRDFVVRRTSNNLWYLAETPQGKKSTDVPFLEDCCRSETGYTDSSFCYTAINTFFEVTEILVNLTGFNPIIRACLAASLKYLKPLLLLMCERNDSRAVPILLTFKQR